MTVHRIFNQLILSFLFTSFVSLTAYAQSSDEETHFSYSPERVNFELRLGTYQPSIGDNFDNFFSGDKGPMVGGEIDFWAYRIPYVGLIGPGLNVGWARYNGHTCIDEDGTCTATDESQRLSLYPLGLSAVLRVDVLARQLHIPIVISPKIGLDYIRYKATSGGSTDGRGGSLGWRWAVQLALELDALEPRAARALDDEWGINHSYLFFELYGSHANSSLSLGNNLAWTAGLGLTF